MPSVNGSYWFLTALAAQLYMLMYLLMFITGIALRIKAPSQPRAFRIPGGITGMLLVAGLGIFGVLMTLGVSFIPPTGIDIGGAARYEMFLVFGLFVLCLPPFITAWCASRKMRIYEALS